MTAIEPRWSLWGPGPRAGGASWPSDDARRNQLGVGVETVDQLAWLRALGIIEVQGYLIGRPRPADEVGGMVAEATEIIKSAG
jgi:predicted signal transduction protein with EAL and GGDEF domain